MGSYKVRRTGMIRTTVIALSACASIVTASVCLAESAELENAELENAELEIVERENIELESDAPLVAVAEPSSAEATELSEATESTQASLPATDLALAEVDVAASPDGDGALAGSMEDIKRSLLDLKRDLAILEEDLLFPASSQVSIFLSMDVGEFFQLDAVTLKINGREVSHHLYTENQVDALFRGGVQKLYLGNVKQGKNRVTAFFTGRGPAGRDYKRATTVEFEKTFEPAFVELKISDSTAKYQPEFQSSVTN